MGKTVLIVLLIAILLVIGSIFFLRNEDNDSGYSDGNNLEDVSQIDVSAFTDDGASFTAEIANRIIEATR
ncbi:MAG: hypothetical protein AABY16_01640 [Nanoarchaeota archaeon]